MKFNKNRSARTGNRRQSRLKRIGLMCLIVLLVIAGGVAAWKIKRAHDIDVERARFARADKDISQLTNELIGKLGAPASSTYKRTCDKPSAEWTDVPLFCNIYSTLFIGVRNAETANSIREEAVKDIKNNVKYYKTLSLDTAAFKSVENSYSSKNGYQSLNDKYIDTNSNINCTITYLLFRSSTPPFIEYVGDKQMPLTISIDVSCGQKAKARYF